MIYGEIRRGGEVRKYLSSLLLIIAVAFLTLWVVDLFFKDIKSEEFWFIIAMMSIGATIGTLIRLRFDRGKHS